MHLPPDIAVRFPQLAGATAGVALDAPNSAGWRMTGPSGTWWLKAVAGPPGLALDLRAAIRLASHVAVRGVPTPVAVAGVDGDPVQELEGRLWTLQPFVAGEARYRDAGVFEPFRSAAEARALGAVLAAFHRAAVGLARTPRPFRGMTCQWQVAPAPDPAAALAALLAGPDLADLRELVAGWRALPEALDAVGTLAPRGLDLPGGIIHGDPIKRNVLWAGDEVAALLDLDLWNAAPLAYDLALAVQPVLCDWPALLAGPPGEGPLRGEQARALLAGYEAVRPLTEAERAALPGLVATCRFEFHLGCADDQLGRGDAAGARRFLDLTAGILRWMGAPGALARVRQLIVEV